MEVMTLAMKESAVLSAVVGFQAGETMNFRPNSLNAGIAPPKREITIPAPRRRIVSEEMKSSAFVILSPDIRLFQNGFALICNALQKGGCLKGSVLR